MRDKDTVILENLYSNLFQEKFYDYNIPQDKKTLMYDFYVINYLEYLLTLPSKSFRDLPDDIIDSVKNMAGNLYPYLKTELLDAVFFAICAEFRHFDSNSYRGENTRRIEQSDDTIKDFFKNFMKYYKFHMKGVKDQEELSKVFGVRKPSTQKRPPQVEKTNEASRLLSYKAVNYALEKTGLSRRNFVEIANDAFKKMKWNSSYGGDAWSGICQGWLALNSAEKMYSQSAVAPQRDEGSKKPKKETAQEITIPTAIDHIYDLQHNTDTVFNKLKAYYKGGYGWIKDALDNKANVKSYYELLSKASGTVRTIAPKVLYNKMGETWQSYLKKHKPDVSFEPVKINLPPKKTKTDAEELLSDEMFKDFLEKNYKTIGATLPIGEFVIKIFNVAAGSVGLTVEKENEPYSEGGKSLQNYIDLPISPKDISRYVEKANKFIKNNTGSKGFYGEDMLKQTPQYITEDEVYKLITLLAEKQNYKLKSGYVAFVQSKYDETVGMSRKHIYVMAAGGDLVADTLISKTFPYSKMANALNVKIAESLKKEKKEETPTNYIIEDDLKKVYKQFFSSEKGGLPSPPYHLDGPFYVYARKSKTNPDFIDIMIQKNKTIISSISDTNLLSNKKVVELINARINEHENLGEDGDSDSKTKDFNMQITTLLNLLFTGKKVPMKIEAIEIPLGGGKSVVLHGIYDTNNYGSVTFQLTGPDIGPSDPSDLYPKLTLPENMFNNESYEDAVSKINKWINRIVSGGSEKESSGKTVTFPSGTTLSTSIENNDATGKVAKILKSKTGQLVLKDYVVHFELITKHTGNYDIYVEIRKDEDDYENTESELIASKVFPDFIYKDVKLDWNDPKSVKEYDDYEAFIYKIEKWINETIGKQSNNKQDMMTPEKMMELFSLATYDMKNPLSLLGGEYRVWVYQELLPEPEWNNQDVIVVAVGTPENKIHKYKVLAKNAFNLQNEPKAVSDWVNNIITSEIKI